MDSPPFPLHPLPVCGFWDLGSGIWVLGFGIWVLGYIAPYRDPIAPLTFPASVPLVSSLLAIGDRRLIIRKALVNITPEPVENSPFVFT